MNILEKILKQKQEEVEKNKMLFPIQRLENSIYFNAPVISLSEHLLQKEKFGIIAEIKRKSPSKGIINDSVSVDETSTGYIQAGASALSILTDKEFFGGSNEDLTLARKHNACPILRKEFIIDEYQLIEAKSIGADAILLIAAALKPEDLGMLARFAHSLGLEVLMEVHNKEELLSNLHEHVDIIGVNNRNLKTFEVNIDTSRELAAFIPKNYLIISESGLDDPISVIQLKEHGYNGFLMGEYFMRHRHPESRCAEFIRSLKALQNGQQIDLP